MQRSVWLGMLLWVALGWGVWSSQAADDKKGTKVIIDNLTSVAPAEWKEEKPPASSRGMRFKQFRLPKVGKDKRDAEFIIFYFGEGSGGSAQENVKRWKTMFTPPKGKKIDDVAKVEEFKVSKVPVTYLDISGTYKFKAAPFVPDSRAELLPDYRMFGVVFESEKGPYFFRLVGPSKTVTHYKKQFDAFLKAFK
jgi:hypothetical protein